MIELTSPDCGSSDIFDLDQVIAEGGACSGEALKDEAGQRTIERGRSLFREGSRKLHAYRVESGIFCLTAKRASGPPDIVELVFPGGLLGLGFLENHIHSAVAVVTSRVTLLPFDSIPMLCELSADLRHKQAIAVEREFAFRRRQLVAATERKPLLRVASFLLAIAEFNSREGRDPRVVTASLAAGDVSRFLNLNVDTLALALAELQSRKLISRNEEGGLLLEDPQGLEALSASP